MICLLIRKEKQQLLREVHRIKKPFNIYEDVYDWGRQVWPGTSEYYWPHSVNFSKRKFRDFYEEPSWSWDKNACGTRMNHISERMFADSYFDANAGDRLKFAHDNGIFQHE